MLKILFTTAVIALSASALADQHVNGYTRSNGTYVNGYERTSPNNTRSDNYSTQGNVNPYTGREGTVNPYNPQPPRNNPNPYGQFSNN